MKTIFGMFEGYEDARAAVDELLEKGFDQGEMNVIVDEELAKQNLEVNLETIDVKASDELGERAAEGLDAMLGVEQPVRIPQTGAVYAAGGLATMTAKAAMTPNASGQGLRPALVSLGVPQGIARTYAQGVAESTLLFWIRTSDERAREAADTLRLHHALHVDSYAG